MAASAAASSRQPGVVLALTALSWLGEYAHNLHELPWLGVLSPENSLPALVSFALAVAWFRMPYSRGPALLLLLWSGLHLLGGGIISVLPLAVLPFYPEQTLDHYAAHLAYGLAQLPLIALMARQLTARSARGEKIGR